MVSKTEPKLPKKRREKTEISVSVGKAIATRRKLVRLTQQKLAEALGVEKETVSRMESGEIAPTVDRLAALSKALNCAIMDFFADEDINTNQYAAAIAHMIHALPADRQERVVRCVAEIVGVWENS